MASDATISTPVQADQAARFSTFPAEGTLAQGGHGPARSIPIKGWVSVHPDDRELGVQRARVVLIRPVLGSTEFRHFDLGRISSDQLVRCEGESDIVTAPEFFSFLSRAAHSAVEVTASLEYAQSATTRYREEVSEVRAQLERERQENARKLDAILDDAHELAGEHDWCSVYDSFLERHGLPARERDYELEVTATVRMSITVQARDAEAAQDKLEDDQVAQTIYDMSRRELLAAVEDFDSEEA
ncbi:hypothetical protein ACTHRK_16605 [Dietzia cercidiphylli]|uniref:hypothetical protein n=1 Tax=Dietzia cercidiphylli TaxID=498199 RepID=UPI003F7E6AF3